MSLTVKMQLRFLLTNKIGEDCHSVVKEILDKDASMHFAFNLFKKARQVNRQLLWLIHNGDLSKGPDLDYILDIVEKDYNLVNQTFINRIIASYRGFGYYEYGNNIERYEKWHKIFDLMEFDEEQRAICAIPWINEYQEYDAAFDQEYWDTMANQYSDDWLIENGTSE